MTGWSDFDPDFIRKRYNRLAPIYPFFEYVFWLPQGIRSRATSKLGLTAGSRVLEVGCGTGRNFASLVRCVGKSGHIYGVDFSEGMLAVAERECRRRGWRNVTLLKQNAHDYALSEPVDGVLFSLSYEVIPRHREALQHAWAQLRPGGCLVVLGQTTPPGKLGRWLRPLGILTSRATVLGDPDRCPWDDLRRHTELVDHEQLRFGYYICRGTKRKDETSRHL